MYPFFESIRLENQKLHFMQEHEARFIRTQHDNWGKIIYTDLESRILENPEFPGEDQKYKCRVVYSPEELSINIIPYTPRIIKSLQPKFINHIDYPYKSTDRRIFAQLISGLEAETEILIFKNGLLTDSSFSNLALYDGNIWWTPKSPLLKGVHRRYLLENGILQEKDITGDALKQFQKIRLINAMMDWTASWELSLPAVNYL